MDDLVQFLRDRLDEDEQAARAATPSPWELVHGRVGWLASAEYWEVVDCSGTPAARENAEHIARHDPARVLREVEAKRRLLQVHRPYVSEPDQACLGCAGGILFERCPVIRLLALPYASHPDHRDAWRP